MSKTVLTLYSYGGTHEVNLQGNGSIACIHVGDGIIKSVNNTNVSRFYDVDLGIADVTFVKNKSGRVIRLDVKAKSATGELNIPVKFESTARHTNETIQNEAIIALTIGKQKVYKQPRKGRYGDYEYDYDQDSW